MNFNNALQTDVLDILFGNRNKSYGAYQLRKNYNKRLSTALIVIIIFCLMATILFKLQAINRADLKTDLVGPEIILHNAETKQPEPVQPPPVKTVHIEPQHVATIKVTTPKIVADNLVTTPPPTVDDMEGKKIDITTTAGNMGDITAPPVNAGTGTIEKPVVIEDYTKQFYTVQQPAHFPGGLDAWKKYLERNLRSEIPTDNGAAAGQYSVIVSFLVDREGNISDVKANNDPGYGTAAEAIRVIAHGPKWIPAVQNGHEVLFRQTQSITFVIEQN